MKYIYTAEKTEHHTIERNTRNRCLIPILRNVSQYPGNAHVSGGNATQTLKSVTAY